MIIVLAKNHDYFKTFIRKMRYVSEPEQLRGIRESTIIILEDWWESKSEEKYIEFMEIIKYLEQKGCRVIRESA